MPFRNRVTPLGELIATPERGLVYGNRLSCLELSQRELWQVDRGARTVQRRSLASEFAAAGLDPP